MHTAAYNKCLLNIGLDICFISHNVTQSYILTNNRSRIKVESNKP